MEGEEDSNTDVTDNKAMAVRTETNSDNNHDDDDDDDDGGGDDDDDDCADDGDDWSMVMMERVLILMVMTMISQRVMLKATTREMRGNICTMTR